jgi:arylsulfatase A-like enzyme
LHLLTAFLGAILFSTGTLAAPDKNEPQLNILLLTVDSFRPDRLGCYGAERAHTPNIDRLARRGVIFTKAYSTAAWTNASLVSMLTGLYPSVHGVERRGVSLPEEWVTPLELLREAGYLVPEINYLFPTPNYRNLGFTPNRIRDVPQFLVAYQDTAFFAWHHFHGPHLPYNPPEKYLKMFLPAGLEKSEGIKAVLDNIIMPRGEHVFTPMEQELVNALYDAELAAQDEEIGRVLDTLDSLGLTGRTIVILSADHGEELFEHGWLGHASTSLNGTLYEELIASRSLSACRQD